MYKKLTCLLKCLNILKSLIKSNYTRHQIKKHQRIQRCYFFCACPLNSCIQNKSLQIDIFLTSSHTSVFLWRRKKSMNIILCATALWKGLYFGTLASKVGECWTSTMKRYGNAFNNHTKVCLEIDSWLLFSLSSN